MRHTQLPRILQRIYAAIALLLFMAVFGTLGFYSVALTNSAGTTNSWCN